MSKRYFIRPSFIIVGAQKCGTSGLFYSLDQHPQLQASRKNEIDYFWNDDLYKQDDYDIYHRYFVVSNKPVGMIRSYEASPEYAYHPECAGRIHRYNPDMKIIFIVRDPIERAYAAWQMYNNFKGNPAYNDLYDSRTFDEAIADEMGILGNSTWNNNPLGYIKRGHYSQQISRYYHFFPNKNVLVLEKDDLINNWGSSIGDVERFLGVEQCKLQRNEVNKTRYSIPLEKDKYPELLRLYRAWNEELIGLIGKRYLWGGYV